MACLLEWLWCGLSGVVVVVWLGLIQPVYCLMEASVAYLLAVPKFDVVRACMY